MKKTGLTPTAKKQISLCKFGGIDLVGAPADGEMQDVYNLTGSAYPYMKTRSPRGLWSRTTEGDAGLFPFGTPVRAVVSLSEGLCYCTDTDLYIGGKKVPGITLPSSTQRQLLAMDSRLFILPDGLLVTKNNGTWQSQSAKNLFSTGGSHVSVSLADAEGNPLTLLGSGASLPATATEGDLFLLTGTVNQLFRFTDGTWTDAGITVSMQLNATGIGSGFFPGDTVRLTAVPFADCHTKVVVCSADMLTVSCTEPFVPGICTGTLTVFRPFPLFDRAAVCGNRIWGCRFGLNADGESVNEVFCSELGNPLRWSDYGTGAGDAYCACVSCPGAFTGAGVLDDTVFFFKDTQIVRITGTQPADYTVTVLDCFGVPDGCAASIVNWKNMLLFWSRSGLCLFDGYNVTVYDCMENTCFLNTVAGCADDRYYMAADDGAGNRCIWVFDCLRHRWYREDDNSHVQFMTAQRGVLYFMCNPFTTTLLGVPIYWYAVQVHSADAPYKYTNCMMDEESDESDYTYRPLTTISWHMLTHPLSMPDRSKPTQLSLQCRLEKDARLDAFFLTADGTVFHAGRLAGPGFVSKRFRLRAPLKEQWQLRIAGKGQCRLMQADIEYITRKGD